MNHPYYQEFLGSMKQFEPITSDQVKKESKGVFGLDELSIFLLERGLSSEKVVYDPTRLYLNTFYADYENGLYIPMLCKVDGSVFLFKHVYPWKICNCRPRL